MGGAGMGRERLALYALDGDAGQQARSCGLAGADWFHSEVPRKQLKELMRRRDAPAIRDTVIWIGLMVVLATAASLLWVGGRSWLAAPLFLGYGVLYGAGGDSRCSTATSPPSSRGSRPSAPPPSASSPTM